MTNKTCDDNSGFSILLSPPARYGLSSRKAQENWRGRSSIREWRDAKKIRVGEKKQEVDGKNNGPAPGRDFQRRKRCTASRDCRKRDDRGLRRKGLPGGPDQATAFCVDRNGSRESGERKGAKKEEGGRIAVRDQMDERP